MMNKQSLSLGVSPIASYHFYGANPWVITATDVNPSTPILVNPGSTQHYVIRRKFI